eukprot:CAMPEP_0179268002 /NCGR_PEP_ID=MMETSP0797-20121207/30217_1 /TAXON_ID=47934 /ORGANISM="Dinophysis acuminata, Strain DAEP01" /LENGTH=223 /DNA_ID=CAMNT_0020976273 /DNA_START=55 /DNA_END=726 /DNA_ORIENTATION=+
MSARAPAGGSRPCAVCFEEEPPLAMPCCGKDGSTVAYCRRCIEIICEQAQGVGRCPSCRGYITIKDGGVSVAEKRARCQMCCQNKIIVDQGLCDACLLGRQHVFKYECQRCRRTQQIPHPMWRYQATPTEFGGASWACHRGCADYTHWRIVPEDVMKVPHAECPESWGRRDDWIAAVRRQRHMELAAPSNVSPRSACLEGLVPTLASAAQMLRRALFPLMVHR